MDESSMVKNSTPDENVPQMPPEEGPKWYYKPWLIVVAILAVGPLGLPLIWFRPATNIYLKIAVTVIVVALTIWMTQGAFKFYGELMDTVSQLNTM